MVTSLRYDVENINMAFLKKFHISTYFLIVVIPLHILAMGMIYYRHEFQPIHVLYICLIYFLVGGLGLEIGFHRMLSHKNFALKSSFLEKFFLILGAFAFQGSSLAWVALHRNHHTYVDTQNDHQAPLHGLWSSYIGWTVSPSLTEKIKPSSIRDLLRSKFHRTLDKYYYQMIWFTTALILVFFPIFSFSHVIYQAYCFHFMFQA